MSILIVSAARTPIGSFNGSLASLTGSELGSISIKECINRSGLKTDDIHEVIMAHVLTAGEGQNPARQASVKAGVPHSVPAWSVNMVCGGGLKAVALGAQSIMCGNSGIVVAGGQESMSKAPHLLHLRSPHKLGAATMIDSAQNDGLVDAFGKMPMGMTAENIAERWSISRKEQDEFALKSQLKCEAAIKAGAFDEEIIPVQIKTRKGMIEVKKDEFPRSDCTIEGFQKLQPCFKSGGSVTAGNSSGINDGSAAVLLMHSAEATKRNIKGLARIVSWGQTGVDPAIMGIGPISAVRQALQKANWTIDEVDLYELNEAFAAQSICVVKELGVDINKVNVNGGAIALGHPIGASGSRVLVTLLYALKKRGLRKGVCALCIGGGMGIALCVEMC